MSNEKEMTRVLPASTSLSRETEPDAGFRSSTSAATPLTLAVGSGSNARGVLGGLKAPERECTEGCGEPVARFHDALCDTASGRDDQVAVPDPRVLRDWSLTWNTTGSPASAIPSWNDTLPAPSATCVAVFSYSSTTKAGNRSRTNSARRRSLKVRRFTD